MSGLTLRGIARPRPRDLWWLGVAESIRAFVADCRREGRSSGEMLSRLATPCPYHQNGA